MDYNTKYARKECVTAEEAEMEQVSAVFPDLMHTKKDPLKTDPFLRIVINWFFSADCRQAASGSFKSCPGII